MVHLNQFAKASQSTSQSSNKFLDLTSLPSSFGILMIMGWLMPWNYSVDLLSSPIQNLMTRSDVKYWTDYR